MQKLLMLRVEPHDGTLQENSKDAIMLAMRLNCKIIFTFDKKENVADPSNYTINWSDKSNKVDGS